VVVWLLPRYGRYTKAAIVHDHLWRNKAKSGEISWREADALFRRAMRELDVAFLRRWLMWGAVRLGALVKPGGREGWWKDAPLVLLLAVVALPILALPVLAILAALVVFFVVELLLWVPLKLAQLVKSRWGRSTKRVNRPSLLLKL
jgi:hypothetical protein